MRPTNTIRFLAVSGLLLSLIPANLLAQPYDITNTAQAGNNQYQKNNLANQLLKVTDLEEQMRFLQGKVEELTHTVNSLETELKQQKDLLNAQNQNSGGLTPLGQETYTQHPNYQAQPYEPTPQNNAPVIYEPPETTQPVSNNGLTKHYGNASVFNKNKTPPSMNKNHKNAFSKNQPTSQYSPTVQWKYDEAFGLLRQEQYAQAIEKFTAFTAEHPNSPLSENAYYWVGEAYYAQGDFEQAAIDFLKAYQAFPTGAKAPDNLLKLSISLKKINRKNKACGTLNKLQNEFPNAPLAIQQRVEKELKSC